MTDTVRLAQGRRNVEPGPVDASVEMADLQVVYHIVLVEVKADNLLDSVAHHRDCHSSCD